MFKDAFEHVLTKTKENIERFDTLFPHVGDGTSYKAIENRDWTNGFWSGILWLCYEYSKNPEYLEAAKTSTESFVRRLEQNIVLDHHDIGFLYSLSTKADWIVTKNENARKVTLQAADVLLKRWRSNGEYIQAWGTERNEVEGGRIIIDCLMNLPLLYWAYEQTGDQKYKYVADAQAEKTRRYLVRGDFSSYHTFHFNQLTGEPIGGSTHQGFTNGSTWSRGQAWGIYGFALLYRQTGNVYYQKLSIEMTNYFLLNMPEDQVAYWDFDAPLTKLSYRDSSASAIAVSGMLELVSTMNSNHPEQSRIKDSAYQIITSLVKNYSTAGIPTAHGLLQHGSYHVRGNLVPDGHVIWGDYFYTEALVRILKGIPGYWYERD
ncbi:unsaturated chondroitin disaccharide hydrolase [Evansella vedderi]|uniref:Unsaturated chondroitin disaccharide hydrolase n=1 Tax=Evansella vedderi TaxID=38282 RepID=A0ABT9ZTV5_9BACI|nr:glycoside hydrolase family 88 protein [Evansella vedderi]MDQ0254111.1 unsaturated chondroitin disaccharide hydrolase [Evansella vedderi]